MRSRVFGCLVHDASSPKSWGPWVRQTRKLLSLTFAVAVAVPSGSWHVLELECRNPRGSRGPTFMEACMEVLKSRQAWPGEVQGLGCRIQGLGFRDQCSASWDLFGLGFGGTRDLLKASWGLRCHRDSEVRERRLLHCRPWLKSSNSRNFSGGAVHLYRRRTRVLTWRESAQTRSAKP